jgi:protein involved in polysaccharide export with SLBB domain
MVLASTWGRGVFVRAGVLAGLFIFGPALRAQDVTVGETPQQTNERIRSLSSGIKNVPHDYILGNGDLLEISVFDVPELTRSIRVSQTGMISIPLVPVRLRVAGLTELQAEQKIGEVLEANGLVSHPEVAVIVREHKSKPITIVGAVGHPMVYEADRQVTLLEALAEAGGVAADAGDTILVTRQHAATFVELSGNPSQSTDPAPGTGEPPPLETPEAPPTPAEPQSAPPSSNKAFPPPVAGPPATTPATSSAASSSPLPNSGGPITINLHELLETGDMSNNIPLQAGDVVTVPHAGIIYVLGAVARPGGFVLANDRGQLTTLKILSLAGGATNIAKLDHAVIIRKDEQGKQSETEVDLKKILQRESEDLQLRPSDILYVPNSRTKQVLIRAAEIGLAVGTSVALYRLAYQ